MITAVPRRPGTRHHVSHLNTTPSPDGMIPISTTGSPSSRLSSTANTIRSRRSLILDHIVILEPLPAPPHTT